ncbi:MAG: hypothetical protein ACRCYE_11685 [Sarcina sp.]
MDENNKDSDYKGKYFYKTIWFWVLVVILIGLLAGAIGYAYRENEINQESTAIQNIKKAAITSDVIAKNNSANEKIDNSSAKDTTLNTGTYTVGANGSNISEGRYMIETVGSGKISIKNTSGNVVEELSVSDSNTSTPMKSVLVLEKGETITITGLNNVKFTPYTPHYLSVLNAGVYQVGVDVKAGEYKIEIPSGNGIVTVNNSLGIPVLNEMLTGQGIQTVEMNLVNGYTIVVNGINGVKLTPIN